MELLKFPVIKYQTSVDPSGDNLQKVIDLLFWLLDSDASQAGVRMILEPESKAATQRR